MCSPLAVLVVILVMIATPTPVRGDEREQARELAAVALRRIADANDYAGASELFLRAYELTRELPFLLNAAVAQRKARLPHQSVQSYRRALDDGGAQLTPELRAQVVADIEHITREAARVTVRTRGEPAEVELDRRRVGVVTRDAPLEVLVATEGGLRHTIRAQRPGYRADERTLPELGAGGLLDVELAPRAIPTTGRITIATEPAAAQVSVVGRGALGLAPQTVELPPGDHEIAATLPGHVVVREQVHLRAGDARRITLRLSREPSSWWTRHRLAIYVAGAVVVGTAGAFAVREHFEPDHGVVIRYP